MKNLIIENNLPDFVLKKGVQLSIPLDNPQTIISEDYNFEIFLFESLSEPLISEKYDAIVVSLNLNSNNSLNLNGLDVAYTLRLSPGLNHQFIPIIILGSLSLEVVLRLNSKAKILLTPGIYYKNLSTEADEFINKKNFKNINKDEHDEFIERIEIKPPSNYQSHHSIANEWALTRYFSMFESDEANECYNSLREKILDLDYLRTLHFKYTEAKASRQKFNPKKHAYTPLIGGIEKMRIGIIDDEINKGWLAFYQYVFNKSQAQSIPFNDFRKDERRDELIKRIQSWLLESFQSTEPIDLFIIDLRLHEDDFSEQDFDNLSGVQVIKFIKSKNKGIQIVVSTASNKVWNFQKCLEYGVSYYSIKESPETYNTREETKSTLVHLYKQIANANQKSFLASLFRDIQDLKANNKLINNSQEEEFENLIFGKNGLLEQILNLLMLDCTSEAVINQCLLLAFQILENYCELHMVGSFGKGKANLSSGFVWQKDKTQKEIYVSKPNEDLSLFELVYGNFDFQTDLNKTFPISVKKYDKLTLVLNKSRGTETTTIIKLISVLHYRESLSIAEIEDLLKIRFYRSNVAAHFTGEINLDKYKISQKEIIDFITMFKKIFLR